MNQALVSQLLQIFWLVFIGQQGLNRCGREGFEVVLVLEDWREKIGVVDQDVFLLNTSVIENIKFSRPDATREAVEVAAKMAHAHEFIEQLEDGYDTVIGDRGYGLSGASNRDSPWLARSYVILIS